MSGERLIRPAQPRLTRRKLLIGLGVGAAAAPLSACSFDSGLAGGALTILEKAEALTKAAQRALLGPETAMAPEFPPGAISAYFKPNGSIDPEDPDYVALRQGGFKDWKLEVGGLVERPMKLSLADLRALPSRSQITRHDCVEGWSCHRPMEGRAIVLGADRRGAEAAGALHRVLLRRHARGDARQHRPLLRDDRAHRRVSSADHPGLRDELRAAQGRARRARCGCRVERQLGYKMAKYIMRIEAIDDFAKISRGRGGFWEDRGYEWYAGI